MGILERGGELVTGTMRNLRGVNVQGAIASVVAPGTNIMTDEHVGFVGLQGRYNHHTVNHSAGQYLNTPTALRAFGRSSSARLWRPPLPVAEAPKPFSR